MYNATYHPLEGELLKNILDNASPKEAARIKEQVTAATKGRIRNYRIEISENTWYDVKNGVVSGSSRQG